MLSKNIHVSGWIVLLTIIFGTVLTAGCGKEETQTPSEPPAVAPKMPTQPTNNSAPNPAPVPPDIKGVDPKINQQIQQDFKDAKS